LVLRRLLVHGRLLLVLVGHELVDRLQEQRDLVLLLLEAERDLLQIQQPLPGLLVTVARGGQLVVDYSASSARRSVRNRRSVAFSASVNAVRYS
jgi:hypothetical protein